MVAAAGLEIVIAPGLEGADARSVSAALNRTVAALSQVENEIAKHPVRAPWVLDRVSSDSSSYAFRVRGRLEPPEREPRDTFRPAAALVAAARSLSIEPTIPEFLNARSVLTLGRLAVPHHGIQSVTLATWNGQPGPREQLGEAVAENARQATQGRYQSAGSTSGWMTRLSVSPPSAKARRLTFTVRTDWPGQAVTGTAPAEMRDHFKAALGNRVLVGGQVTRNGAGQIIRIAADRMEPMPQDDSGRVNPDELVGAWQDTLGGMTSDEFIDAIRNA